MDDSALLTTSAVRLVPERPHPLLALRRTRSTLAAFAAHSGAAGAHVLTIAMLAGALVALFMIGVAFLVVAAVLGALALVVRNGRWAWSTFGAAIAQFTLASLMLTLLRQRAREPIFPADHVR